MKIYWKRKKAKIREKFREITDNDLRYIVGREYEMLKKLSDKLGKTEEEILSIIIDL